MRAYYINCYIIRIQAFLMGDRRKDRKKKREKIIEKKRNEKKKVKETKKKRGEKVVKLRMDSTVFSIIYMNS